MIIIVKNYYHTIVFSLLLISISFAQVNKYSPVERGKLLVIITGFANNDGDCWFALDNSKEIYESDNSVFIGKILPIINNEVRIVIDSVEYGDYAIRVFHDENKNGKLDSNFLGIPTEDYGYSNNVSAWFGPPRWERAKFSLNKKETVVEISVD